MLGFEDEVVIDFVFNMLDKERVRRIIGPCRFTFLLIFLIMFKGWINKGGWSKALLALFACHPKFLASAKLFAVPKVPKVPNF